MQCRDFMFLVQKQENMGFPSFESLGGGSKKIVILLSRICSLKVDETGTVTQLREPCLTENALYD